jgi:hypothetical protein
MDAGMDTGKLRLPMVIRTLVNIVLINDMVVDDTNGMMVVFMMGRLGSRVCVCFAFGRFLFVVPFFSNPSHATQQLTHFYCCC